MGHRRVKPTAWSVELGRAGLAFGLAFGPACGPVSIRPPGAEPARVLQPTIGAGPASPDRGLPIPDLAVPWSPPRVVAGSTEALARALAGHDEFVVRIGNHFAGDVWAQRVTHLLEQLGPATPSTVLPSRGASRLLHDPALVLDREDVEDSGDWAGAPMYGSALFLAENWRMSLGVEGKTGALVVLDDPALEPAAWAAMPARALGSCAPALDALAAGQEQSLAYLETFLDHADDVLWAYFRSELNAVLPEVRTAVKNFASESAAPGSDRATQVRHTCGHADWVRLQAYEACLAGNQACAVAPRMFLIGGARIGSAEPVGFVDQDCPGLTGRDVPEELRQVSRDAAAQAITHLDLDWVALADRLGTLTEVNDALEDVCTPRRRRFADADLQVARQRLEDIGDALASRATVEPGANWSFADASFFVPGTGPVSEVARFDAGAGSEAQNIRAGVRALRQFVLSRALCRSGYGPTPLLATVVDLDSGSPVFASYFYEEELFCADLSPLGSDATAEASAADASLSVEPDETSAAAPPP